MAEGFGVAVRGVKQAQAAVSAMDKRIDLATLKALKAVQGVTKSAIKSGLRGRPRWDHRGKSSRTGAAVNLGLSPHHVSKGGGPGKLTGSLSKAIRSDRKPRPVPGGGWNGVVLAGSKGGPQNLYKGRLEATYPYFKPGVNKAMPKVEGIWVAAWRKATA